MAILQDIAGTLTHVRSYHVIGRNAVSCDSLLQRLESSQLQAIVRWNGEHWTVQDISRNGTWLNGERMTNGIPVRLPLDSILNFASIDGEALTLTDDDPPQCLLHIPGVSNEHIALSEYQVLEDSPEGTLSVSRGSSGEWTVERNGEEESLSDGSSVIIGDRSWIFWDSREDQPTTDLQKNSAQLKLMLDVSQDEEHVVAGFRSPTVEVTLGERTHHYLLLLLARRAIEHRENDHPDAEVGWTDIEELQDSLRITREHLNIQVCRIRKQFADALPGRSAHELLARRTGQIRVSIPNLEIRKAT